MLHFTLDDLVFGYSATYAEFVTWTILQWKSATLEGDHFLP
jgi:hypothetical protein